MPKLTRRVLLSATATGTLTLPACTTPNFLRSSRNIGEVRFIHGVASGDPLHDRIILWTRVTPDDKSAKVEVGYEVIDATTGLIATSGAVFTDASRDFTVKVDATGLNAATPYTYKFTVLNSDAEVVSPIGRTRTTALSGDAPVRIAVVSCSNWQFGFFNAYQSIAEEEPLDAIVHLGDYLYEYGIDGYGGETAKALNRKHDPEYEIVTLSDYRRRHAQYRSDVSAQSAHAAAPWICTWDDHESTNNSYRTGAENHDPDQGEGSWSDRKQVAIQAYFEWMPIREPKGNLRSAAWRSFTFGDVATLHALESRLTGRSEELSWAEAIGDATDPEDISNRVQDYVPKVLAPERTLLGKEQEDWLANELSASSGSGKTWQILANQVIMARVKLPNLTRTLSPETIGKQIEYVQNMIGFSALGMPMNLDAWDGFPAARDRLYAAAKSANARLITLTGDTHEAWANNLHDATGEQRGVEFGCTSVTSPGTDAYVKDISNLGERMAAANSEVIWNKPEGHGYTIVTFTDKSALAEYREVSTVLEERSTTKTVARFTTRRTSNSLTPLAKHLT
ncbi:MAG: alkaline phosphatase D family protein [Hyphomonas sp.]